MFFQACYDPTMKLIEQANAEFDAAQAVVKAAEDWARASEEAAHAGDGLTPERVVLQMVETRLRLSLMRLKRALSGLRV